MSSFTLNQKICGSGDAWMRHERVAGRLARTLTNVGALGSSRRGGVTTLNTYVCSSDPATLLAIQVYEPAWNSLTLLILSSDFWVSGRDRSVVNANLYACNKDIVCCRICLMSDSKRTKCNGLLPQQGGSDKSSTIFRLL